MNRKALEANVYYQYGKRLKQIREHLDLSVDQLSEASGVSRSYIAEFERGVKFPNSKFLKHLSGQHNVSIDYIFNGWGSRLLPNPEEYEMYYKFGKFEEEIREVLYYMIHEPHALYALLGFFTEYKLKHLPNIEKLKKARARAGTDEDE